MNFYKSSKENTIIFKRKRDTSHQYRVLFLDALSMHYKGHLDEAIARYKEILVIEPGFKEAWYALGIAMKARGQEFIPNLHTVWFELGNSLKAQGDLEAAIDAYRKAVAIKDGFEKAWDHLGLVLHEKGELNAAVDAYRKVLRLNEKDGKVWANLALALDALQDWDAAAESYQKALDLNPRQPELWVI